MAAENNLHQGHRERMRERIAQQGFESLADHEALEVLLYLTNPRKNTNVMAHALLKRFGSFSRVLDAEEEELCKVEGVGPATARMLHLMPEICKYYTRCRASEENCLRTTEQLAEFLKSKFLGADRERALLMALDSRSRVRGAYWGYRPPAGSSRSRRQNTPPRFPGKTSGTRCTAGPPMFCCGPAPAWGGCILQ